ncbi:MAG: molybdopterin-dependent oxidoreductase [Promethearchaeota archaeon]
MKFKERLFQLKEKKYIVVFTVIAIFIGVSVIVGISFVYLDKSPETNQEGFPDFITKNEDYYEVRLDEDPPEIDINSYTLRVWGLINSPRNFTYSELLELDLIERLLTIECIGNSPKAKLLSTAVWKGFSIFDFLTPLGLKENAIGVKYLAADGYYASHTIEQIKDNGTIGALYMNGETLPINQGFPLRIINPGYYGAKQPAWVVEIEVIGRPLEDFWDDIVGNRWDTSPPMAVDSTIYFPANDIHIKVGEFLEFGGAAYGGTRISKVEYTLNDGLNWSLTNIVKSVDLDHVWVFWNASVTFNTSGIVVIFIKATDIYNISQPRYDLIRRDGYNPWPSLNINVTN